MCARSWRGHNDVGGKLCGPLTARTAEERPDHRPFEKRDDGEMRSWVAKMETEDWVCVGILVLVMRVLLFAVFAANMGQ